MTDRRQQLVVETGIRVEPAPAVSSHAAIVIGEPTTCLLDQEDPGGVVPRLATIDQERINLTANQLDEREVAEREAADAGGESVADRRWVAVDEGTHDGGRLRYS